jgi:hypothetical protein
MAKQNADISPRGIKQGDLVDLMYMLTAGQYGLAVKLDVDVLISNTLSLAYNAVFNCTIVNSKGNYISNVPSAADSRAPHPMFSPTGITNAGLREWMYQFTESLRIMCVRLDAGAGISGNVAACYTAILTPKIPNYKGDMTGAGSTLVLRAVDKRGGLLVDWLYRAINAVYTLTTRADASALTAVDYESLWFTNNITLTVENSQGNRIGN